MSPNDNADDLERLSRVQAEREDRRIAAFEQQQAQLIGVIEKDHDQTRGIKFVVVPSVVLLVIVLIGMLLVLFFSIMSNELWVSSPETPATASTQVVPWALFVSLVFSITTITVALLVGVFRSPHGSVVENLLAHGGRAAAGSTPTGA